MSKTGPKKLGRSASHNPEVVLKMTISETPGQKSSENRDSDSELNVSHRRQRRKEGLAGFRSELTKFLSNTRRKHSTKDLRKTSQSPLDHENGIQSDEEGYTKKSIDSETLRLAIRNFDSEKVMIVLASNKLDINEGNSRGITALHEAAIDGNFAALKMLLDKGASINQTDKEGFNCLDYAVYGGNFECASYLIKRGAQTEGVRNGLVSFQPSLQNRRATII